MFSFLPPIKMVPLVYKCPLNATAGLENGYSEISEDSILQQGQVFKRKPTTITFKSVAKLDSVIMVRCSPFFDFQCTVHPYKTTEKPSSEL